MNIVIFDDDAEFAGFLENNVKIISKQHNIFLNLTLSSANPHDIIFYLKSNVSQTVFLLDIVADNKLWGYKLAEQIKSTNQENIIIYITNYATRLIYDINQKLTALSFIIKKSGQFLHELEQSLLYARKLCETNYFTIENNNTIYRIKMNDIYYFEKIKSTHKICVIYKDGYAIFEGSLTQIKKRLEKCFCLAHKSFIVNTKNVKSIDKKNHLIYFDNEQKCTFSVFYKGELLKWILN